MDEGEDWGGDGYVHMPPQKWSWTRLGAVGVQLTCCILTEISEALECVASLMVQHSMYKDGRLEMHEQGAMEIEQLVEGEHWEWDVVDPDVGE